MSAPPFAAELVFAQRKSTFTWLPRLSYIVSVWPETELAAKVAELFGAVPPGVIVAAAFQAPPPQSSEFGVVDDVLDVCGKDGTLAE